MSRVVHAVGLFGVLLLPGCGQEPRSTPDPDAARNPSEGKEARAKDLQQRGQAALAAGRLEEAEDCFTKAVEIMPEDESSKVLLRDCLQKAKDAKQNQLDADYQRAMSDGREGLKNKGYQRARDAFTEALRLKDGDKEATALRKKAEFLVLPQRGHEAVAAKRYEEAVDAFTAANQRHPDDPECREFLQQEVKACRKQVMAAEIRRSFPALYRAAAPGARRQGGIPPCVRKPSSTCSWGGAGRRWTRNGMSMPRPPWKAPPG
jgi:tetratricopeptide (TPR) repeat protein